MKRKAWRRAAVAIAMPLGACLAGPPDPAGHITVYTFPGTVQVGEKLRVTAGAFSHTGFSTRFGGPVRWTVSDTSVARLITGSPSSEVDVRGVSPGVVTLTATSAGLGGTGQVRVIPRLTALALQPSAVTVAVGDTVRVAAIGRDEAGRPVADLPVQWEMADYSVAAFGGPNGLVLGRAPGTTTLRAKVGSTTASVPVTVVRGP